MFKKLLVSLIAIVCLVHSMQATIVNVACYFHPSLNQHVHILSDWHGPSAEAAQQKKDFVTLLRNFNPAEILVITEDPEYNTPSCKLMYQQDASRVNAQCAPHFLNGLTWLCDEHGIPTYDAEFRECTNKNQFTSLADFYSMHYDPIVQEIQQLQDNPILNTYYQGVLHRLQQHESATLEGYRPLINTSWPVAIINPDVLTYGLMELFDARILHAIYNNSRKKHIFVCVGDRHKNHIGIILEELGYKALMNTNAIATDIIKKARDRDDSAMDALVHDTSTKPPVKIPEYYQQLISLFAQKEPTPTALSYSKIMRQLENNTYEESQRQQEDQEYKELWRLEL